MHYHRLSLLFYKYLSSVCLDDLQLSRGIIRIVEQNRPLLALDRQVPATCNLWIREKPGPQFELGKKCFQPPRLSLAQKFTKAYVHSGSDSRAFVII